MTIRRLDGMAAMLAATNTKMCKQKGEKDTEFVKRIVNAYMDADEVLQAEAAEKKRRGIEYGKIKAFFEQTTGHRF